MSATQQAAYQGLAVEAARRRELNVPADPTEAAGAVADDEAARAIRDELWTDYERMLADERTWTLDAIVEWLGERNVTVGRSSVHRDRVRVLAHERQIALAAEKARAVVEAADGAADDLFAAGRQVASQHIFEALLNLGADALSELDAGKALKMIDSLSRLSKAHAEAALIDQRVAEMRRRFDEEVAAAQRAAKPSDGRLTAGQIAEIRRAVFGEAA